MDKQKGVVQEPKALPWAKKGREALDASLLIDLRTKINLTSWIKPKRSDFEVSRQQAHKPTTKQAES
jgi:hypothetical protein